MTVLKKRQYERVICPFTTPKTIITDNGPEFNNAILTEICRLFFFFFFFFTSWPVAPVGFLEGPGGLP